MKTALWCLAIGSIVAIAACREVWWPQRRLLVSIIGIVATVVALHATAYFGGVPWQWLYTGIVFGGSR